MVNEQNNDVLYLFIDESGNFDFSSKGTRYFVITSLTVKWPFEFLGQFSELRHQLLKDGHDIESFHCSEDNWSVREGVFEIIESGLDGLVFDSIVIEKPKCNPAITQKEVFYPKMLGYLLRYICRQPRVRFCKKLVIITDEIPVSKNRKSFEKAIKSTLSEIVPQSISYEIYHHKSSSHFALQLVDYGNWTIFRKWERGDPHFYDKIKSAIWSEFNIFKSGNTEYYPFPK